MSARVNGGRQHRCGVRRSVRRAAVLDRAGGLAGLAATAAMGLEPTPAELSRLACERLCQLEEVRDARAVAVYAAKGSELDPRSIMEELWRRGAEVYCGSVWNKCVMR